MSSLQRPMAMEESEEPAVVPVPDTLACSPTALVQRPSAKAFGPLARVLLPKVAE